MKVEVMELTINGPVSLGFLEDAEGGLVSSTETLAGLAEVNISVETMLEKYRAASYYTFVDTDGKHLPGRHNQARHGRGGGGALPALDFDDMSAIREAGGGWPSEQYAAAVESLADPRLIHENSDFWFEDGLETTKKPIQHADATERVGEGAAAINAVFGDEAKLPGKYMVDEIVAISPVEIEVEIRQKEMPNTIGHRYLNDWLDLDSQGGGEVAAFQNAFQRPGDFIPQGVRDTKFEGHLSKATATRAGAALQAHSLAKLQELGFKPNDEITLFRGMDNAGRLAVGNIKPGQKLSGVAQLPLSAWSADPITAKTYAGLHGTVLGTKVKAKDVVGWFGAGIGSAYLSEFVIPSSALDNNVSVVYRGKDRRRP